MHLLSNLDWYTIRPNSHIDEVKVRMMHGCVQKLVIFGPTQNIVSTDTKIVLSFALYYPGISTPLRQNNHVFYSGNSNYTPVCINVNNRKGLLFGIYSTPILQVVQFSKIFKKTPESPEKPLDSGGWGDIV